MTANCCRHCGGATRRVVSRECVFLLCRSCDMAIPVTPPSEEDLSALYTADYYRSWGEDDDVALPPYWPLKRALFHRLLTKFTPFPKGAKALDVGCATGACLSVFDEMGLAPHGVDINPYAIGLAGRRVPGAVLHNGPLATRPPEMNGYALAILSDVVEHVESPVDLLREVSSALSPGGLVIILTPDIGSVSARVLGGLWPHFKREHITLLGRQGMRRALEAAGFVDLDIAAHSKMLSLEYAARQMEAYPMPLISPLVGWIARLAPQCIHTALLPLPIGEILASARLPRKEGSSGWAG